MLDAFYSGATSAVDPDCRRALKARPAPAPAPALSPPRSHSRPCRLPVRTSRRAPPPCPQALLALTAALAGC